MREARSSMESLTTLVLPILGIHGRFFGKPDALISLGRHEVDERTGATTHWRRTSRRLHVWLPGATRTGLPILGTMCLARLRETVLVEEGYLAGHETWAIDRACLLRFLDEVDYATRM